MPENLLQSLRIGWKWQDDGAKERDRYCVELGWGYWKSRNSISNEKCTALISCMEYLFPQKKMTVMQL